MDELISKWEVVDKLTALENELQQYKPFTEREQEIYRKVVELEMAIGKTPAVEAEPVVHAHREWKDLHGDGSLTLCCSNCLETEGARETAKFCSECGACFDGEVFANESSEVYPG